MLNVILIIVGIGILLIALLLYFALRGLASIDLPETAVNSINSFLGFSIKGDYKVIEHSSQSRHPDRPVKTTIYLPNPDFELVKDHLATIELNTTVSESRDGKIKYRDGWDKRGNSFTKFHTASYVDSGMLFFAASVTINCDTNTLTYQETGF